ncbi:MAG: response regulator transcription factor [Bacteroidetes bacterium]|nr:response regulator transcription factor [Bacteroidota bacterium]
MNKITVLLADDHALIRAGFKVLMQDTDDIEVVGEAGDAQEVIAKTEELSPDVVVMDISMGEKDDGLEATQIISERFPNTKVLILSMHDEEEYVYKSIKCGAHGYLLKGAEKELIRGIKAIAKGEKYFGASVSKIMTEGYIQRAKRQQKSSGEKNDQLTKREIEILELIVQGLSSTDIAEKLSPIISPRTVETHKSNMMKKLNLKNTPELVKYALENKLI